MKKWLIKRPDGTATIASSDNNPSSFLEEGWVVIENQDQEFPTSHLDTWKVNEEGIVYADNQLAVAKKLVEMRRVRDAMLKKSDEKWVELKSKGLDATSVEADKAVLRDLPNSVEAALTALASAEEIEAYDIFGALNLSTSYE